MAKAYNRLKIKNILFLGVLDMAEIKTSNKKSKKLTSKDAQRIMCIVMAGVLIISLLGSVAVSIL